MPEALTAEDSLISSDSLPEFEDLEKEYQESIAQIIAEEEASKTAGEKPKKTRKKKESSIETASPVLENESIQVNAEDIEDWVCLPLDFYFNRTDKKPLSNIEKKAFSRSTARLLNKYAPAFTNKFGDEIGFLICLTAIFASRMKAPEVKPKEKKPKEEMHFRNSETEKYNDNSFGKQTDPIL